MILTNSYQSVRVAKNQLTAGANIGDMTLTNTAVYRYNTKDNETYLVDLSFRTWTHLVALERYFDGTTTFKCYFYTISLSCDMMPSFFCVFYVLCFIFGFIFINFFFVCEFAYYALFCEIAKNHRKKKSKKKKKFS